MLETTKKPAFDPHQLLAQLQRIVSKHKEPTKGGGKSWVSTLIIIAVVLVGAAVWYWLAARRGRELARLRHEKNKAKLMKEDAVVQAQIAENDEFIAEQEKIFNSAEKYQKQIEAEIRAEEKRYEADMRAIDDIRSWRDAAKFSDRRRQ